MKILKLFVIILFFLASFSISEAAVNIDICCLYGIQTINNVDIRNIYGNGQIFFPTIFLNIWKGFNIGFGYETGFSKDGNIGIYKEVTNLKMNGIDVFIGYEIKSRFMSIFMKGGYGIYSYKQYIDNPSLPFKVSSKKNTIVFGGGLKLFPIKNLFIIGEVKYVPLKVKPFEDVVDLGGLRILGGVGIRI